MAELPNKTHLEKRVNSAQEDATNLELERVEILNLSDCEHQSLIGVKDKAHPSEAANHGVAKPEDMIDARKDKDSLIAFVVDDELKNCENLNSSIINEHILMPIIKNNFNATASFDQI